MNSALRYIFWGYLFIFFRLEIIIDLFMDPIGYLLIFLGCAKLVDAYPQAKKAMTVGTIGLLVSIPSIFLNDDIINYSFGWAVYSNTLILPKLIIAYYIFVLLVKVVKVFGDQALLSRTAVTFNFYIVIYFLSLVIQSFSMNVSGDGWLALSIIFMIAVVLADIIFLLLIGAVRRVTPLEHRMDSLV